MKILDCTLRDGGYYTNWDFDRALVDTYIRACNGLPIDYLEVGYRSPPQTRYMGEYFYLPTYVLERLKMQTTKKLVVILDEKHIRPEQLPALLEPCKGLVDLVRMAIDPKQFDRALKLAEGVKAMGFRVGFNVMYMSRWKMKAGFLSLLPEVAGIADYFYMVDSFGGVYPEDVRDTIQLVKSRVSNVPLGFHGHNNLELGLINTLTALEEGCAIVDATITGMGRGAGNTKMELLLTALHAKGKVELDFMPLSNAVDAFSVLQQTHQWGTNLPYMVSGARSLPQKDVMDWVGKRFYSFNSIIRALQNQANGIEDNEQVPNLDPGPLASGRVLIVGGGESVQVHRDAIIRLLLKNSDFIIIHASSKNVGIFRDLDNLQICCLGGSEGVRLENAFPDGLPKRIMGLLPPFPRKMGTYIPERIRENAFQVPVNRFVGPTLENITSVILECCYMLTPSEILITGYDGYSGTAKESHMELFNENEALFEAVKDLNIRAITPTQYKGLEELSIYTLV